MKKLNFCFKVAETSLKFEIRLHACQVGTITRSGTELFTQSDWLMRSEIYDWHITVYNFIRILLQPYDVRLRILLTFMSSTNDYILIKSGITTFNK